MILRLILHLISSKIIVKLKIEAGNKPKKNTAAAKPKSKPKAKPKPGANINPG